MKSFTLDTLVNKVTEYGSRNSVVLGKVSQILRIATSTSSNKGAFPTNHQILIIEKTSGYEVFCLCISEAFKPV